MRRRPLVTLATAGALVLAACGDGRGSGVAEAPAAADTTSTTAAPAAADCNPLESFEPTFSLPAPGNMPAGTYMATIAERGRLVVGVSADTLLFGARNPIEGRIEGFDIDVLREVAKAIFGDADKIEYRIITYAERIPLLQSGEVDLVAHTMTINCERWQQISFSTEYFTAGQNLLVRKSLDPDDPAPKTPEELVGPEHKVCVAAGSTNLQTMESAYPEVQLEVVDDLTDCLVLFQQSAVDAITGDNTVMAGFAEQDPYGDADTPLFTTEPYGIGVNKDHPELVEFVNLVLEEMRTNGRLMEIGTDWLRDAAPDEVPQAVYGREPGT